MKDAVIELQDSNPGPMRDTMVELMQDFEILDLKFDKLHFDGHCTNKGRVQQDPQQHR